jgi:hypothetical protein
MQPFFLNLDTKNQRQPLIHPRKLEIVQMIGVKPIDVHHETSQLVCLLCPDLRSRTLSDWRLW